MGVTNMIRVASDHCKIDDVNQAKNDCGVTEPDYCTRHLENNNVNAGNNPKASDTRTLVATTTNMITIRKQQAQ